MTISGSKLLLLGALLSAFVSSAYGVDCVDSYQSSENYFPFAYTNDSDPFTLPLNLASVDTAFNFTVQYSNSYKVVRNSFSNETYILYQCGTPSPSEYSNSANVKLIQIPVKGIGLTGTTPIPYLELLGLLNQVQEADESYTVPFTCSACMQKIFSQSNVSPLNPNSSLLIIQDMFTPSGAKNYISFDATSDPGPLKRAEWIKFLALFFNLEAQASSIYQTIKSNYECFNGSSSPSTKPIVAWVDYYNGSWTVSDKQYKKDLVRDAGGLSPEANMYGIYDMNNSTQSDAFKEILKTVDVLIDESFAIDPPSYTLNTFASNANISSDSSSFPFLANKRLWREDRRVASVFSLDWLETAPAQPQIALQELVGILNPSITHQPYFFRNLALGEQVVNVTSKDCERDYNKPLSPIIYSCPISSGSLTSAAPYLSIPNFFLTFSLLILSTLVAQALF